MLIPNRLVDPNLSYPKQDKKKPQSVLPLIFETLQQNPFTKSELPSILDSKNALPSILDSKSALPPILDSIRVNIDFAIKLVDIELDPKLGDWLFNPKHGKAKHYNESKSQRSAI